MSDDELKAWGEFGRLVTEDSARVASPANFPSLITVWNVIGELEKRIQYVEAE